METITPAGLKIIITGSTGMVGEGVLHVCLNDPAVAAVLVINRKTCGVQHPKLTEIIHADFFNLDTVKDRLAGFDACFFCLGVSSIGMKEPEYTRMTYTLTMTMAGLLSQLNNRMTFCYISGASTDSSENGNSMWARVKGKTENDLMKLPFQKVYAFRPGFIKPIKGLKFAHKFYSFITWMFPIGRKLYPGGFCTMEELANAMINSTNEVENRKIFEGGDIIRSGKRNNGSRV